MSYRNLILAEPGLVSFWEFAEAAGATTAADSIGPNPGTYTGGFTLAQPGIPNDGQSVLFNGSTGWVSVADNNSLDLLNTLSVEVWAKPNTVGVNNALISKRTGAYYMRIDTANHLGFLKSETSNVATSTNTFTADGKFHHCVTTWNGTTCKQYVDGVDVSGATTATTLVDTALALAIGADGTPSPGEFMHGNLAYPAVYNVILNPTQIAGHFVAGSQVTTAPPVHLPF